MKILPLIKEILDTTQQYQDAVEKLRQQGGKFLGSGDYGAAFLVGDKVHKVTTDSEELEDAQNILGITTTYFVHIYDVQIINEKLGIIVMERLFPYTADPSSVPLEKIQHEADNLGIYPDLEGPGGRVKIDNVMQDANSNIKIIDV